LLAVVAALPMTRLLGDYIGMQAFRQTLPLQFSAPALLAWTVLALAAAAAARRASRLTVREALASI
jgi:putative ABC transport system permease protein